MKKSDNQISRREFLSWFVMGGSLVASYGLLATLGGLFIYPDKTSQTQNLFVAIKDQIVPGKPLTWTAPSGQKIIINNINGNFLALSNVCPHLGCKVHWDEVHNNFFCPCHSGVFDKDGNPVSGPPKSENLKLKTFDLIVKDEAVYIKWETA